MTQLEKDIRNAIEIIKNPYGDYESMTEYSRIYQNTSENIKLYMPYLAEDYKNALLPTSSGDHQLEAILSGITDITCFDINRISKYFAELKFGALKNLTRKEFIYFMYENVLSKQYFDFFKDSLDSDIYNFWYELYKKCNVEYIRDNLFRYLGCNTKANYIKGIEFSKYSVENFTSYLQEDNYKLVQDKLQNAKIKYITSDILELANILNDKYDLMNLTNIYEFINRDIVNGGAKKFADTIKKLITHLNDNGKILITYLYKCNLEDIEKYRNKEMQYVQFLCMLEKSPIIKYYHDGRANKNNQKTIMDKLYAFRNAQLLRYLKELNIDFYELEGTGLGCGMGDKDLVLIHKKL